MLVMRIRCRRLKGNTMTNTPPPAGFYPDAQGTSRWWDGQQWTDQTQPAAPSVATRGAAFADRLTSAGKNIISKSDPTADPDAIWAAVGKPITGIGGGRYKLTAEYLLFESGTLRTRAEQIRVHEIHDVDAKQSMAQKARGVGTITLWADRPSGREQVQLEDIPNFREGVAAINDAAFAAREGLRVRENTQHVNYQGSPIPQVAVAAQPTPPAPAVTSPAGDLNAELERLAGLHQSGVLTDDEFSAAKRKMLGL
jgi:hypothetical protein